MRAGLHLFVFTHGGLNGAQTGEILVHAYPAMLKAVASVAPPSFHSLHRDGSVSRLKLGGV